MIYLETAPRQKEVYEDTESILPVAGTEPQSGNEAKA
jgi:hypothetical protein